MRVLRTILGMLLLSAGLPALLVGAGLWAAMQHRDAGGAYSAQLQRLATPGYAYVVEDVDGLLRSDAPFARLGSSRLGLAAGTPDGPAFLGLAPADQVSRYLAGVPHSTVNTVDLGTGALPVATIPVPGVHAPVTLPGAASFWTRTGLGQLTWTPGQMRDGPYSLVIMSPGAKPGLQVAAAAELRPSWLNASTWGLLTLGTLLVMIGLVVLAWPAAQREVVYIVEPSQVPALMKAIGAPMPINRSRPGAHRPRTLADAQKVEFPPLPLTTPSMPWPPIAPATAAAAPSAAEYAAATAIPVGAGAPVGERSPAPGEPLSFLTTGNGPVSPATGDADSIFGRRGERRTEPDLSELPPFQASAVGAWVAETAPARARETEAQATARMAEVARLRAAGPGRAVGPVRPGAPSGPGSPVPSADDSSSASSKGASPVEESGAPQPFKETAEAAETNAPETGAPETGAPETGAPETDAPKTDAGTVETAKTETAKTGPTKAARTGAARTGTDPAGESGPAGDPGSAGATALSDKGSVAADKSAARKAAQADKSVVDAAAQGEKSAAASDGGAPVQADEKSVGAEASAGDVKQAGRDGDGDVALGDRSELVAEDASEKPTQPTEPVAAPADAGLAKATRKASAKEALAKEALAKEAQAKEALAKEALAKEAQAKQAQAKEAQAKEAQAKEAQAKEAQAKEAQAKEKAASDEPDEPDEPGSPEDGPQPPPGAGGRPGSPDGGSPAPGGSPIDVVAAAYAAGAADARAARAGSRPAAEEQPAGVGARQPSPEASARQALHPSEQLVSVVTGPRATDWSATWLARADSPRVGRPMSEPVGGDRPSAGRSGFDQPMPARPAFEQPGSMRPGAGGSAPAGPGSARPGTTGPGTSGPGTAWPPTMPARPGVGGRPTPGSHSGPATDARPESIRPVEQADRGPQGTPSDGRGPAAPGGRGPMTVPSGPGSRGPVGTPAAPGGRGAVVPGAAIRPGRHEAPTTGSAAASAQPGATNNGNGRHAAGTPNGNAGITGTSGHPTATSGPATSGQMTSGPATSGQTTSGSTVSGGGRTADNGWFGSGGPSNGAPVNGAAPANGVPNGGRGSVVGESGAAPVGNGDNPGATAPAIPRPAPTQPVGPPRPIVPSPARPSGPSQPPRPEPGATGPATNDPSPATSGSNRPVADESMLSQPGATSAEPKPGSVHDRTDDEMPAAESEQASSVRADGPRPTTASVIARIQGQGTPSAVAGDWAQAQAQPTQAIHLVIPGHPAATRPVTPTEDGGPSDSAGAFDTGETVAAEPLATAGDLTGPIGHGREALVVEFGRPGEPPVADPAPAGPVLESGLLAQAQARVDGTFTPSQTGARPTGLGLGRPAPAAWRKAAESVAARAAGLTEPAEAPRAKVPGAEVPRAKVPGAEVPGAEEPGTAPAAKATRARTTRTSKKAEPVGPATRPRAAKAAKADAEAAKPGPVRRPSGKPEVVEPAAPRATRGSVAKATPAVKSGAPAVKPAAKPAAATASSAAASSAAAAGSAAASSAAADSLASYRTEAAELLAGAQARRRRRTVAEPELPAEKSRRRGAADQD